MDQWDRKLAITWIAILGATSAIMLLLLLTGDRSLHFTLVIFLIIVKFLAGFGNVIGVAGATIFLLTKLESHFKGEENRKKLKLLLVVMVGIIFFLLAYQGPYKIIGGIVKMVNGEVVKDNPLDQILFVYGIVSLMWSLYIQPLWKGDFLAVTVVTTGDMVKQGWSDIKNRFKKKISTMKKDYAKVEIAEQQQLQEHLKTIRQRLAVVMMLFLGAGNLVFTVICAALIFGWIRIFYITSRKPYKYETIILVLACVAICAISAIEPFVIEATPFYDTIKGAYFWTYIASFTGLLICAIIYLRKYLGPIMAKRKVQQIKNLKEEKEELEKEKAEIEKQKKQIAKENKKLKKQADKPKGN
jgi:Skp family chaperone for outer membrane proteins